MPRLKKHANRGIASPEEKLSDNQKEVEQTQAEDLTQESDSFMPSRMKCSDRVKLFEKETKKKKERKAKKVPKASSQDEQGTPQLGQDSQINKFLNKYTDEDDIGQIDNRMRPPKRKSEKEKKPEIKTKNKMFSDVNFQDSLIQQNMEDFEKLSIQVEKKEKRKSDDLFNKIQKNANFCKNKLEHKDLHKDEKYKKQLAQKLKAIKEVEELNIIVEPTKIFGGGNKTEIQNAFHLKNTKERTTQEAVIDKTKNEKEIDENTANVDRKTYYEELGKKLRMKRTETLTESVLKERFKKSMLDDKDFIDDFKENRRTSFSEISQSSYSHQEKLQGFKENRNREKESTIQGTNDSDRESISHQQRFSRGNVRVSEHSIQSNKEIKEEPPEQISLKVHSQIPQNEENKEELKSNMNEVSTNIENSIQIYTIKQKRVDENVKKKFNKFKYNNLIEFEAELSDDEEEGGPKHHDEFEDSDVDEDTNLHSLIDDNVQMNSKDQQDIHRKFIKDMIEEEDKKYEEMRAKMEKKYIEEEENMKKRMEEAAKRNMERDENQQKQLYAGFIPDENSGSAATSNATVRQHEAEEKIKQLEDFLNGAQKTEKEVRKVPIGAVEKLDDLQKAILGGNKANGFKKAERIGLKNVRAHKKPIHIPLKK